MQQLLHTGIGYLWKCSSSDNYVNVGLNSSHYSILFVITNYGLDQTEQGSLL